MTTTQQCPPLPDDLIAAICAHVHLRQRLSICAALSQGFRQEVRRLGGSLTLRRSQPDEPYELSSRWNHDYDHNGCCITQQTGLAELPPLPFPRLGGCFCPTSLNLVGFDVYDNELGRIIQGYASRVTTLQFHDCTGEALEWHAALVPMLCTVTTLGWYCPLIPVHTAVSILGAFHRARLLRAEICIMPQPMPYTSAQLRGAFLCLGGLAAMSLRDLELHEGPSIDSESHERPETGMTPGNGRTEFGCPDNWYWKSELTCDGDVISGLMLGLSALSGLRTLKTDMLSDWSPATATGFALMLSRMPALESLGDESAGIRTALSFAFESDGSPVWDELRARLGPAGHPSLRELCLRYRQPEPADLELMARSMRLFPRLQRLRLELVQPRGIFDIVVAPGDQMSRVAYLLAGLRTHPTLRELVFDDLHIPGMACDLQDDNDCARRASATDDDDGALALALAPLAGLAPSVDVIYGTSSLLLRADVASAGIFRVVSFDFDSLVCSCGSCADILGLRVCRLCRF